MTTSRNTIQRSLVMDALHVLNHPTADKVYEMIAEKHPTVSRATVYRNLNQMSDSGEILKIPVFGGADHYDMTAPMHYHGICSCCGEVYDLEIDSRDIEELKGKIKNTYGFKVEGQEILFKGLCADCQKIKS